MALLAAALLLWLVLHGGEGEPITRTGETPPSAVVAPVAVEGLRVLPAAVGHPVYWAGQLLRRRLQLVQTADGAVAIGYLAPGARAGDPVLTIRSRPLFGAFSAIEAMARAVGATVRHLRGGGLAVVDPSRPTVVRFGYPNSSVQGAVEGPLVRTSLQLVTSGRVRPIGGWKP